MLLGSLAQRLRFAYSLDNLMLFILVISILGLFYGFVVHLSALGLWNVPEILLFLAGGCIVEISYHLAIPRVLRRPP